MAKFEFRGKTPDGKVVNGHLDAASEEEAYRRLHAENFEVESVKAVGKVSVGENKSIKAKELQIFTRQMATLVDSGVHISQSLELMAKGAMNPVFKRCLQDIHEQVTQGKGLAESMSKYTKIFDRLYISMVMAGEEGGVLDVILDRLAKYLEKAGQLKSKVKAALWYPISIVIIAMIVIIAIFIFVIPQFQKLFSSAGQDLPTLTVIVITISEFLKSYWYILVAALCGVGVFLKKAYDTEAGRYKFDEIILKMPLFGSLVKISSIARFARTLATLLASGVTILDALEISSNVAGNRKIEEVIRKSKDEITKGKTISANFLQSPHIPDMVAQMMAVGEQTGNLDEMLNKIADFYEDEVDNVVSAMTSLIEPILMIVLGGIIAVLVISMYLPIFNLANVVGG